MRLTDLTALTVIDNSIVDLHARLIELYDQRKAIVLTQSSREILNGAPEASTRDNTVSESLLAKIDLSLGQAPSLSLHN